VKSVYIIAILGCLLASGCNSEPSLQKYFVEKTENKNFIALDVSPSVLNIDMKKLTPEEKKSVESFEKVNILAFRIDENNKTEFAAERENVAKILKDEKYQQLMKFGKGKEGGSISFVGSDEHIEEFVLYANRNDSGFAVIRILGNDMNPTDIMNVMSVLKQSDINMDQLKPLQDMMMSGAK
jgi:hypothetical protein